MKRILLLLFLAFSSVAFSQRISGIVLDKNTNKPVEKAHIILKNKVVLTNSKGQFSFYHRSGNKKQFLITHINYNDKSVIYKYNKPLKIYLIENQEVLNEVSINAKRNLKKKITFKKLDNLPKKVHSFASVLIDNKIFVFGGDLSSEVDAYKKALEWHQGEANPDITAVFRDAAKFRTFRNFSNKVYSYDLSDKKWIEEEGFKLRKRANHNAITLNNKIYLFGGKRLSRTKKLEYLDDKFEILDIKTKEVITDDTNPHQAVNFGASSYKENIIVSGGSIRDKKEFRPKKYNNKVHLYNTDSGLWYELGKLPVPKETTSIVLKDKVYFFGGYSIKNLKTISTLDIKTGKWKKLGDLPVGLKNPSLAIVDNTILIFENRKLFSYNTKNNVLKQFFIGLNLFDAKIHVFNDTLYIVGGKTEDNFESLPQKGFYSVDLEELDKTKPEFITNY